MHELSGLKYTVNAASASLVANRIDARQLTISPNSVRFKLVMAMDADCKMKRIDAAAKRYWVVVDRL